MPCMELIRKIDTLNPELKEVLYCFIEEIEKDRGVRSGFIEPDIAEIKITLNDLKSLIKELAETQKETEDRLQKLIKEHETTKKQIKGINKDIVHMEDMSSLLPLGKPGYLYGNFPGSKGFCQI
jgi:hypothetical protein